MNNIQTFVRARFGKDRPNLPEEIYKDRLRIPKRTFGRYLRNEKQPSIDEVKRIASWLGVDPKELVIF